MLKATIKGVLPSGEVVDRTFEGDLVNAFAIKNREDGAEVDGCIIGNSESQIIAKTIISSLFETVKNEENEQEMLELAVDLIKSRLDELAEAPEAEDVGHPDVKVAVMSGSDAVELLKGLLGGR